MKKSKNLSGLFLLLIIPFANCLSQQALDSIIHHRNNTVKEFMVLSENDEPRTWIKMSETNAKAKEIIDADNILINEYLYREIERNSKLEDKIEKLTLEMALVKKETELQARTLDENNYLIKVLFILIVVLIIMLLFFLIMFIDRQIRYRSIKLELDRTWPLREEIDKDGTLHQEITKLNKQIGELMLKNSSLINEIDTLKYENRENLDRLENELKSKKQFEEDIKKLINQIKAG
jgi:hypothetical protein